MTTTNESAVVTPSVPSPAAPGPPWLIPAVQAAGWVSLGLAGIGLLLSFVPPLGWWPLWVTLLGALVGGGALLAVRLTRVGDPLWPSAGVAVAAAGVTVFAAVSVISLAFGAVFGSGNATAVGGSGGNRAARAAVADEINARWLRHDGLWTGRFDIGPRFFGDTGKTVFWQARGFSFELDDYSLSESDRLNNIGYHGTARFEPTAVRVFTVGSTGWSNWVDFTPYADVEQVDGRWEVTSTASLGDYDSRSASFLSGSKPAVGEVPAGD